MSGSPEGNCFGQVTYSPCMLACCYTGSDHLGMIPVYEHTVFDIRFMLVDNHYISGTDVAMKNTSFVSGFVSCNVRQNTVIRR